ncbi:MAG: ABC transporter permease [Dorea sp.]|nr:ABC transporter permease [Dorea sp.]
MFCKQVRRNAAKNRKGNGLFFGSLVIAIVAFYTLLSLGEQDVMRYLATIESDAVGKLMMMLPAVYAVSLFFVFFLVYFACKYQTDSRKREFGLYLMLGMKRSRLFFMLFAETLWSSLISLLTGIPIALFLTEGISLATAKIVGLGIIGHHFSFSPDAMLWTVCGFILVQLLSMLVICMNLVKAETAEFFRSGSEKKQAPLSGVRSTACFTLGTGLLIAAYYLGIFQMHSLRMAVMLAVIVCGILGTFLLYRGLGGFLGQYIRRKSPNAAGLKTFTARQVQENVLSQHKSLAISSLLLLMALSCISYGISMGFGRSGSRRSVDFSLFGTETEMNAVLEKNDIDEMVEDSYPLYLSAVKDGYDRDEEKAFDTGEFVKALRTVEDSDNIIENLHIEYVIGESSYNRILKNMGKEELKLADHETAIYTSMGNDGDFGSILTKAISGGISIGIDGVNYSIRPTLCMDNVVADRAITLYMALVVPDELFTKLASEPEAYCRNVNLKDEIVDNTGLMQAIQKMDAMLEDTGIEYDSYLGGIGRNLFYTVAASYLTIYLGVLFWLIANTVIGLKYLISQRQTKHRYETLTMLGADTPSMCRSVKKQIGIYFVLVLSTALVSSAAAIFTMFRSFTKLPVGTSVSTVALISAIALVIFAAVEIVYIGIVKRTASREVSRIEITNRR